MTKISFLLFLFFLTAVASATPFDVLREEVERKSMSGNPGFVGDYANVNEGITHANIFKLPPCSSKNCSFDFSSNIKVPGKEELFTCSPPAGLKVNFANNDKAYIFIETPSEDPSKKPEQCSLRLEMKDRNQLVVSAIVCPQTKIGDCERDHLIGTFRRLGRPGFDCGVLTPYLELTPARRTICHNLELSELDHDLELIAERAGADDDFRKAETTFMRSREACGTNEVCLKGTYMKWRDYLKTLEKPKVR